MSINENVRFAYYKHSCPITTRWSDNDQYGHLNNSIYYQLFDAIANSYLVNESGLNPQSTTVEDVKNGGPIGLVIASGCRYWGSLEFPTPLVGGLTVGKLGSTSVTYHMAVFKASDVESFGGEAKAAASGWFTHVFVDPNSRRPTKMTKRCRESFLRIAADDASRKTQARL